MQDLDILAMSFINPNSMPSMLFDIYDVSNFNLNLVNVNISGNVHMAISAMDSYGININISDSTINTLIAAIDFSGIEQSNVYVDNTVLYGLIPIMWSDNQYSSLRIRDSEIIITDFEDETGIGFWNDGSYESDFEFTNVDFYTENILPSAIIVSESTITGQTIDFNGCTFEVNQAVYNDLFVADMNTDYWIYSSKVIFKEGITSIPDMAFGNTDFSDYVFPSTLISIGNNAFENNGFLSEVILPEGLTTVGSYAFSGCNNLSSAYIPQSIITVKEYAFTNNNDTLTIYLSEGIDFTDFYELWYNESYTLEYDVKGIVIEGGITYVGFSDGYGAVIGYDGETKDVEIADTIQIGLDTFIIGEISPYVFSMNLSLETIIIPNTILFIGKGAFAESNVLRAVTILPGSQLLIISDEAFIACTKLESFILPESVQEIGYYAFAFNNSLSSFEFLGTSSLTTIRSGTFVEAFQLRSIVIPASVLTIEEQAFANCYSLASLEFATGSNLFSIDTRAFYNNFSLTSVNIPASVFQIGERAFSNNYSLTEVTFDSGSGLYSVGWYAFAYNDSLVNITLPDSVGSIGDYAFKYCTSLETFRIPLALTTLRTRLFDGNISLVNVIFPEGSIVTTIGSGVFANCDALITIALPDSLTTIGTEAFTNCDNLAFIELPDSVTLIDDRAFYRCSKLLVFNISEDSNLTTIGTYAFAETYLLGSIFLSDTITMIEAYAFYLDYQLIINGEAVSEPTSWDVSWNNNGAQAFNIHWAINHRTMTIDLDNGDPAIIYFEKIGTTLIEPDTPVKTGYTFVGWNYYDEASTNWLPYVFGVMPETDIDVIAIWEVAP
jgi:hypothetical protein